MRGWVTLLLAGLMLLTGCNKASEPTGDKGELTLKFWNDIQAVMKAQTDKAQENLKNMSSGGQSPGEMMRQMAGQHQESITRLSQLDPSGVDEELVARRDQLVESMKPVHAGLVKSAEILEQKNMAAMQAQQETNKQLMTNAAQAARDLKGLQATLAQRYSKEFPLPESKTPMPPAAPTAPETPASPAMP